MVVSGPWPGSTLVSSGSTITFFSIEVMSAASEPYGKSVRPIDPANNWSPENKRLLLLQVEATMPRGMPGGVSHLELETRQPNSIPIAKGFEFLRDVIDPGWSHPEHRPQLFHRVQGQEIVVGMDIDAGARRPGQFPAAAGVVDVTVGENHRRQSQIVLDQDGSDGVRIRRGVDHDSQATALFSEDVCVGFGKPGRNPNHQHQGEGSVASRNEENTPSTPRRSARSLGSWLGSESSTS